MKKNIKNKANALAKIFYGMQGYKVADGYDFSKASHPQEKNCWNMSLVANSFFEGDTFILKYQR